MSVPSVVPILPFAPSGRNSTLRNYYADPQQEPCPECPMSSQECLEPLCSPFSALTTQCTDQCVVIACNDPDHAEPPVCDKQGSSSQCNDIMDCTDCDGFEDFLQCCENYAALHPLPSQSQRTLDAPPPFSWETSLNDVWCNDCTTKSTDLERHLEPNLPQHAATQGGSQTDLQQRAYPSPNRENHFHLNSYPPFVSDGRPPFSCMWGSCGASFASLTELIGHVNLNHLISSSSSTFPNNLLPAHDPPFEQIKSPMTCKWGDCTSQAISSFNDADLLTYHLLREHLGVTSPASGLLNQASPVMQPATSNSLSFDTTIGPDTSLRSNLTDNIHGQKTHLRATSPGSTPAHEDDPHSCSGVHECKWKECGLLFPTCAELTAHITVIHIGSGQAQYECFWDHCPRSGANGFQSKQKICRHVQSHTGHRPFQCTICQQYFSEAATLQQHIRRHTQEKPYVCDHPGCGKSFAITGALTIHKRTHNGDKPFKCLYCERGFAESSNLSKHLRTHTGARPYVCTEPDCSKAFARPDQLNRHKSVHKKQHRGVGSGG